MNYSPNWIAPLLACAIALSYAPAWAGPGHDHGDAPAPVNANGPQRLPDGSVFLPKPAQRQIGLRILAVEAAQLPRAHGTERPSSRWTPTPVVKVQALQAGRLEAGPRGLPSLGQAVRNGSRSWPMCCPPATAWNAPAQTAQLAELRAAQGLAAKRLARLKELADSVPRKEIEAAESELASLTTRGAAIAGGLGGREALLAPVSGVIASAHAVAGQVLEARELVFEVVDPTRLRVEALSFEAALASDVANGLSTGRTGQAEAALCGRWPQPARTGAAAVLPAGRPKGSGTAGDRSTGEGGGADA
jgi:cobalt-zinc-cadmium efflux system membrane fusion protein